MGKRSSGAFDRKLTEPEVGVRALWLLYKRGQWGLLEDFGLDRSEAEPALQMFERYETVTGRLNKRQCKRLIEMVPGLDEAGKELRLAYVLKKYDRSLQNDKDLPRRSQNSSNGRL